ncbi:MAG: HD domain-containing protein, partial [Planctomycetaceae bacterium]|nr:HD domain-containing protein [Planctomycetaceae bacterium]
MIDLLVGGGASDCLFVGGCVRDAFLGIVSKDFDVEVYGLSYDRILRVLRPYFNVGLVGESFGTIKVDNEIDLSIPRTESKSGVGHTGFDVLSDPYLDPRAAFARRDFTINAIGLRMDGSIYDPFGGVSDLEHGILRAASDAFREDPLRVLRGVQFAARFGFEMEPRTVQLCREILPEYNTLSAERIWMEWQKWGVKGHHLGKGLRLLKETGWISCFPEIAALVDCPQNQEYHPEGDVFTHTTMVCDAAANIADEQNFCDKDRMILVFSGLCHDFGKPATTIINKHGKWSSPNHQVEGVTPATTFLERMRAPNYLVEHVRNLVREHRAYNIIQIDETPDFSSVRRLANRLTPSNIRMWTAVCRADALGCGENCK